MSLRRSGRVQSISKKSTDLAMAVPQVMAHRLTRMAIAGPTPTARDRKEFQLMVQEKQVAFTQAWYAMFQEGIKAQQALSQSLIAAMFNPFGFRKLVNGDLAKQVQTATLGVLNQGMVPVHQKAVANAKRLSRTKLR